MAGLSQFFATQVRETAPYSFRVLDVRESGVDRDGLVDALSKELLEAHKDPEYLRTVALRAGMEYLREYLSKVVFPTKPIVRIGNFGEVVSAALLRDRDDLRLPIFKLRYRDKRNWPMRLTDIFALEFDEAGRIRAIWYGEVKARTTRDDDAACKGHESLKSECDCERPEILDFVISRLFEQGRYEEANALEDLLAGRSLAATRCHQVTLLFDRGIWREDVLRRLNDLPPALPSLRVEVILVDQLGTLIEDSYKRVVDSWNGTH